MQIVIDIPEEVKHKVYNYGLSLCPSDKEQLIHAIMNGTPFPNCKDCKYIEYDSVAKVDGIPLIVAHEICSRWGDGCKTKEDGYCFLYEPQESENCN